MSAIDVVLDPFRMIRDIRRTLPKSVGRWGGALNIPQAVGGLVFITRPEGAMILVSWALGMMIAGRIHRHRPFSKLIGICHATWLPVLPFLLWRLASGPELSIFYGWLAYTVVTMLICLALDIRDLDRYVRGIETEFQSRRT